MQGQADVVSRRLQQQYPDTNKVKGLRIDPLQSAMLQAQTPRMMTLVGDSLAPQRVIAITLTAFSAVGLLLAALGLYGLLAQYVSERTHELGVRMALGAEARRVIASVLWRSARMIGAGLDDAEGRARDDGR